MIIHVILTCSRLGQAQEPRGGRGDVGRAAVRTPPFRRRHCRQASACDVRRAGAARGLAAQELAWLGAEVAAAAGFGGWSGVWMLAHIPQKWH